ncbi:MAG TPA: HAMP domain-containing sensor histidine kinase [Anaerolineales bacterium]
MRRKLTLLIIALLPAVLGFSAWQVYRNGWSTDFIIYLRASLGLLLFIVGVLLSTLIGIVIAFYLLFKSRTQKESDSLSTRSSIEHRQFLQRLDHELKNPLTTLQIELANLDEEPLQSQRTSDPVQSTESPLKRIRDQVTRLNDMVLQLRKLADLQTSEIERSPVKLDELLDELVTEFSASKPNLTLNVPRMPWSLPEVRGDEDLLYLALRNVLVNAIKFTQPDESIQVRAFEDTNHIVVEIADEGFGIPEDELPHVKEELYRGRNARGTPGSGLGLALVNAIVERHGGQITIRSRINQGTVVALRLPRM